MFAEVSGIVTDDLSLSEDFSEGKPNEDFSGDCTGEDELSDRHFEETAGDERNGVSGSSWDSGHDGNWVWDKFGFDVFTVVGPVLETFSEDKLVWPDYHNVKGLGASISSCNCGEHVEYL